MTDTTTTVTPITDEFEAQRRYRAKRRDVRLRTDITARRAIFKGKPHDLTIIAAVRRPGIVRVVDRRVGMLVRKLTGLAHELWPKHVPADATVTCRYDWTWRTENAMLPRSRGGLYRHQFRQIELPDEEIERLEQNEGAGVSLRLARRIPNNHLCLAGAVWEEYAAFHADREIGNYVGTWRDLIACLTAHEVAHAIQFRFLRHTLRQDPHTCKLDVHGEGWRDIYREFRRYLGLVRDWDWTRTEMEKRMDAETVAQLLDEAMRPPVRCSVCDADMIRERMRRSKTGEMYCSPACRAKAHRQAKKRRTATINRHHKTGQFSRSGSGANWPPPPL